MGTTPYIFLCAFALLALSACTTGEASITPFIKDTGTIEVYFCPQEDCSQKLATFLSSANTSVHCSFFDLNNKVILKALEEKEKKTETDIRIILANTNKEEFSLKNVRYAK